MSTTEESRAHPQKPWVTIAVAVSTALTTGAVSIINTEIKTRAADKRSDAGYEVTKKAVDLLQAQQLEHYKQEAALVDHVKQLEKQPASAPANSDARRRPVSKPRAPLLPFAAPEMQHRIVFRPTLDAVVDATRAGESDVFVHEIYEGPPDGAPQWTKDADKAANKATSKKSQ